MRFADKMLGRLFYPQQYLHMIGANQLTAEFNEHLSGKVLVFADEATWGGDPRRFTKFTESDVSIADDRVLLSLMRDSGCAQVLIGFEAPTRRPLEGLERRSNWKAKRLDRYYEAIDTIQSFGITVNGCFVLGLDGAGPESFEEVLQFVRSSGLYEVQVTVQTAFPGTPLYDRLQREGRIIRDRAWELCTLFDVNFRPTLMSVSELEQGLRHLAHQLYGGPAGTRSASALSRAAAQLLSRRSQKRRRQRDPRSRGSVRLSDTGRGHELPA